MVEVLKHILGLCGEHWHPNLINISIASAGLAGSVSYVKYKIKKIYGKAISKE